LPYVGSQMIVRSYIQNLCVQCFCTNLVFTELNDSPVITLNRLCVLFRYICTTLKDVSNNGYRILSYPVSYFCKMACFETFNTILSEHINHANHAPCHINLKLNQLTT